MIPVGTVCILVNGGPRDGALCTVIGPREMRVAQTWRTPTGIMALDAYLVSLASGERAMCGLNRWLARHDQLRPIAPPKGSCGVPRDVARPRAVTA